MKTPKQKTQDVIDALCVLKDAIDKAVETCRNFIEVIETVDKEQKKEICIHVFKMGYCINCNMVEPSKEKCKHQWVSGKDINNEENTFCLRCGEIKKEITQNEK